MAVVIVNGHITTEGEVIVSNRIEFDENGKQYIATEGVYKTETYIEEIDTIETRYLKINDVFVVEEVFSSETKEIIYRFVAKNLERLED